MDHSCSTVFLGSQHDIVFNSCNLVRVPRRLRSPCPSHRSRTAQRLQVPRPARSRHSVLLSHTFRWALLAMSEHRRGHCALCLPTTADASTQLSIPEFLQLCFTKHPFRRTVPLQLHEDLTDAQCPSDSVNPRGDTFVDAATELSFAEFFERCILFPPRHIPLLQAHWCCNSISSSSGRNGLMPVPRTQPDCTPPPPPGLEDRALLGSHHNILTKAAPVRPHSHKNPAPTSPGTPNPSSSTPTLQPQVSTTQMGTHTACSSATHKRSASTALAGTHSAISADPRAGRGLFPEPRPVVLPVVRFGLPKPAGLGFLHNADSDFMHHQFRLCVLLWNPGPARRNPTQIFAGNFESWRYSSLRWRPWRMSSRMACSLSWRRPRGSSRRSPPRSAPRPLRSCGLKLAFSTPKGCSQSASRLHLAQSAWSHWSDRQEVLPPPAPLERSASSHRCSGSSASADGPGESASAASATRAPTLSGPRAAAGDPSASAARLASQRGSSGAVEARRRSRDKCRRRTRRHSKRSTWREI